MYIVHALNWAVNLRARAEMPVAPAARDASRLHFQLVQLSRNHKLLATSWHRLSVRAQRLITNKFALRACTPQNLQLRNRFPMSKCCFAIASLRGGIRHVFTILCFYGFTCYLCRFFLYLYVIWLYFVEWRKDVTGKVDRKMTARIVSFTIMSYMWMNYVYTR